MSWGVVEGVLALAAVTAAMVACFAAITEHRRIEAAVLTLARRFHPAPAATPECRPIEAIAVDVRRLAHEVRAITPGQAFARREGIRAAYDDVLAECCSALDVRCGLLDVPAGPQRELERLRVEYELGKAGLFLDDAA